MSGQQYVPLEQVCKRLVLSRGEQPNGCFKSGKFCACLVLYLPRMQASTTSCADHLEL